MPPYVGMARKQNGGYNERSNANISPGGEFYTSEDI